MSTEYIIEDVTKSITTGTINGSQLTGSFITIDSSGISFRNDGTLYGSYERPLQLHTCLYCGTRYKLDLYKCPNCYAPNKSE